MKTNNLAIVVLLLVSIFWVGCEKRPIIDSGRANWYIDNTISACGVESCVDNLPWLLTVIDDFLQDTVQIYNDDIFKFLYIDLVIYKTASGEIVDTYFLISKDKDYPRHGVYEQCRDCHGDIIELNETLGSEEIADNIADNIVRFSDPLVIIEIPCFWTSRDDFPEWHGRE